ncbi:MAG: YbjQ family protein [Chloroflexota bacterium]
MIITTSSRIEGRTVARTIGLARGSTIRARHLGKDIMAAFRGMVGGEISEYTKMMAEAREEALQRMVEDAEKQGANAVIDMRFGTSMVMQNAAEVLAYGTGVVLK